MNAKEYQHVVADKLKEIFEGKNVSQSWRAFPGWGRRIYQPVLDIAVGPFAIE